MISLGFTTTWSINLALAAILQPGGEYNNTDYDLYVAQLWRFFALWVQQSQPSAWTWAARNNEKWLSEKRRRKTAQDACCVPWTESLVCIILYQEMSYKLYYCKNNNTTTNTTRRRTTTTNTTATTITAAATTTTFKLHSTVPHRGVHSTSK